MLFLRTRFQFACVDKSAYIWLFEVLWILTDSRLSEEQAPALHKHIDLDNSFVYFGSSFTDLKKQFGRAWCCRLWTETWSLHWMTGMLSVWVQKKAAVCQFAIPCKRQWLLLSFFFTGRGKAHSSPSQKCHILMSSVTLFRKGPMNADLHKVKNASSKQHENWFCDRLWKILHNQRWHPKFQFHCRQKRCHCLLF